MRVSKLELKNVGPFQDAVFEIPEPKGPGELVLFEGPNGSGKTTLMQAIACAAAPSTQGIYREALNEPRDELGQRIRGGSISTHLEAASAAYSVSVPHRHVPGGETSVAERLIFYCFEAARPSSYGPPDPSPLHWAAFAYKGHQVTPVVETRGPTEIDRPPLQGALGFGQVDGLPDGRRPASADFGQLLVNLDYEVAKAQKEARRSDLPAERREELDRLADAKQRMLNEIARALSEALDRKVVLDFPFGQSSPTVKLDGVEVPLALLGEGLRSTFAWLADLLVRLHRITWASPDLSPLEQDFWLILDEIDESLHPTMQMRILPALRRLFPNARMYVTTHSPFVVASVGSGTVFAIRPDQDRLVRGVVEPRALEPGQSLEWVVTEIFQAHAGFVDQTTRDQLAEHDRDVRRAQRKGAIDWTAFLARRAKLMQLNDEVRTVVALREAPLRREIDQRMAPSL